MNVTGAGHRHDGRCGINCDPAATERMLARVTAVHTPGTLTRVPNQPKTPIRGFRIPDELYQSAKAKAAERDEDLSTVIRAALERYVKRK